MSCYCLIAVTFSFRLREKRSPHSPVFFHRRFDRAAGFGKVVGDHHWLELDAGIEGQKIQRGRKGSVENPHTLGAC